MRVPQLNVAPPGSPKTLHAMACLSYYLPLTKSSRFVVIAFATSLLWFGLAASVAAQLNPPMPSEHRDREKESLYNLLFSQFQLFNNLIERNGRSVAFVLFCGS